MIFDKPNISEADVLGIMELYFAPSFSAPKVTNLGGIPNSNYRIQAETYDHVLKIYSKGQSSVEHIEKEVAFVVFMQQNGILTLSLICGTDGNYLQYWNGYPVTCSKYISGRLLSDIVVDDHISRLVGEYVASFVETAAKCDVKMETPNELLSTVEYVFKDINRQCLPQIVKNDLDRVLSFWGLIAPQLSFLEHSQKHQCVHMDLWPYNLIINDGKLYSIDYDDWMYTSPIFELAVVLLEFCMFESDEFDWNKAQSIIAGYRSYAPLNYTFKDLHIALQYLCILWYGYNLVESDDYSDAQIYIKKLEVITTNTFKEHFYSLP